jgi:hypothetical protein
MTTPEQLERLLDEVVACVGDPAPQVYERLFCKAPELRGLFVNDSTGAVRGEMFHRAIDTLHDLVAGRPYADGMIASERVNHVGLGVSVVQFNAFFETMGEVFREALGPAWSAEFDAAWRDGLARLAAVGVHGGAHGSA